LRREGRSLSCHSTRLLVPCSLQKAIQDMHHTKDIIKMCPTAKKTHMLRLTIKLGVRSKHEGHMLPRRYQLEKDNEDSAFQD
jgi:hypothetical protein